MKISQKQASLLASEIFTRLKKENKFELPTELVQKITAFKKHRSKLESEKEKIVRELNEHDCKLSSIVGKNNISRIRGHWDEDDIVQKLQESLIPTLTSIEDKIILKSMFSSKDDMETFVESLVREFTPKKVGRQFTSIKS